MDVIASSKHDRYAEQDYQRLRSMDMLTARDGLRWHRIEKSAGKYDFESAEPMVEAAARAGIQVIWDLLHFGWPDHYDIFDSSFSKVFCDFSLAAVRMLARCQKGGALFVAPVNEISFLSWAGGDAGFFYPFAQGRGYELKKQLARAAIESARALWAEFPTIRFLWPEPVIHVTALPDQPWDAPHAEGHRMAMFQAWDMIAGRNCPELGGSEDLLDVIGVNYYRANQWLHGGPPLTRSDARYRPFAEILKEIHERYRRPMVVSETGAEDEQRAPWFRYVRDEVKTAMAAGVDLHGICLYPIVNHPGWDDDRHCENGLWDYAAHDGSREIYKPLAQSMRPDLFIPEPHMNTVTKFSKPDVLCFSHLRWNFVFQRPQHLMTRFARERRVFYVEEPKFENPLDAPYWEERVCAQSGVHILLPHLPEGQRHETNRVLRELVQELVETRGIHQPLLWFYTAMALEFLPVGLEPSAVIYDCMDELSAFQNAPARMRENENQLFAMADLVFTGGVSLFEAKRDRHPAIFPFPSGVDVAHFSKARQISQEEGVQREIPRPRIGFAGVIDERMDLALVGEIARLRPAWHLVMVGPVMKIDPAALPQAPSIHWLGMQQYADLPGLFAGWDVAMMPFALNDSTRFISPTKTPEYLAAGLPVVSTPIRDVIRPYGAMGLARIAADATEFVGAIEEALREGRAGDRQKRADEFLKSCSWDDIWRRMNERIEARGGESGPAGAEIRKEEAYV